jgi:hypothetical protein
MVYKQKHEVLANMLQNREQFQSVLRAFVAIVAESFRTDKNRLQSDTILLAPGYTPTQAEIKARTDMCYDLFMAMRHDLHWSTQRSIDTLPVALRTELDGGKWQPQEHRHAWGAPKVE